MSNVSVLMYHALENAEHSAGAKNAGEQRYVLKYDLFSAQMEFLHREGYRGVLFEELLNMGEWPEKSVVLTFDDGHESDFVLALPVLQKYGFKAEFFITTDWIGTPHFMTVQQLKNLHGSGMGIGSHGMTHSFLDGMNSSEIEKELRESMNVLTRITGRKVVSFSAPGGRVRREVTDIAEDIGYEFVCTSQPGVLKRKESLLSIPRITVRADTELEAFKAMVCGNKECIAKMAQRDKLLFFAKKVLGNKIYEQVRKILLRSM